MQYTDGKPGRSKHKNAAETSSSQEVKVLTEEDLPDYQITDVLLPLPGWNVEYPRWTDRGAIRKGARGRRAEYQTDKEGSAVSLPMFRLAYETGSN